MTRFITKKDAWGKNKHIPIREGGNRIAKLPESTLSVMPEKEGKRLTGDDEYLDHGKSPDLILQHVRKFIIDRELSGILSNDVKEEFYAYSPEGDYRSRKQFRVEGGSFDYIIGSVDEKKKYMVNGSIKKKGSAWSFSGIGTWMER